MTCDNPRESTVGTIGEGAIGGGSTCIVTTACTNKHTIREFY